MKKFYFLPLIFIVIPFLNHAQNVGIGEAAPSSKFEIKGDGSDLLNIKDPSDDSKLFINSNGDVGIGTGSPDEKLDVAGNIDASGSITSTSSKSITYPEGGYLYNSSNSHSKYIVIWLPDNPSLRMMMNIKASFYRYSGEDAAEMMISGYTYPPGTSWNNTSFSSEGNENINTAEFIVSNTGRFGIVLTNNGSKISLSYSHFVIEKVDVGYDSGSNFDVLKSGWDIQFADTYPTNVFKSDRTSRMRVAGDLRIGNLGSGVLSSDASGNITSGNINWSNISGIPGEKWNGNNNTTDAISRTGNVGIGTTPSYKLDVNGDIRAQNRMYVGTGGGYFYNDNGSRIRTNQDFYTNNSNTYLYATNLYLGNSSGDNIRMRDNTFTWTGGSGGIINAAGNIGVGNTSPAKNLHVSGDARVDGSQGLEVRHGLLGGYNQSAPGSGNWGANIWSIGSSWNGTGFGQSFDVASGQYGLVWLRQNHPDVNSISNEGLHIYRAGGLAAAIGYQGAQFTSNVIVNDNLGVGTTAPVNKLDVRGFSNFGNAFTPTTTEVENILNLIVGSNASGQSNGIAFYENTGGFGMKMGYDGSGSGAANALRFYDNNDASIVTIQNGGNVGIGLDNPTYKLHVNGRLKTNGINETSDIRYKKNIAELENSLEKLVQLRGVSYDWREDEFPDMKFKEGKDLGVIAQEIEMIFPEVVSTDSEGYKSVQYSHLVPVLIEAIKEQQEIIEAQKAENRQQKDINHNQSEQIQAMAKNLNELNAAVKELQLNQEMTKR